MGGKQGSFADFRKEGGVGGGQGGESPILKKRVRMQKHRENLSIV